MKLKLRSTEEISNNLCYETADGSLGLDGIAFNVELLEGYDWNEYVGTFNYDEDVDFPAIEVGTSSEEGVTTYVHISWLKELNGKPTINEIKKLRGNELMQVTRTQFINITEGTVIPKKDLPGCECGALATSTIDDNPICEECFKDLTKINNYSYKPVPVFFGEQLRGDTDAPLHFGIEVEVSTNKDKLAKYMYKHKEEVYLKSDTSIRGSEYNVEMVSHPHTFKAMMEDGGILDDMGKLPTNEDTHNGVHLHISRTVFTEDKHYSLFYFLLHSMEKMSCHIGGRELTNYCSMVPNGRIHTKKKDHTGGERQVYLNENNQHTVEARFFLGTTNPDKLKAYVQYLESMIKYTKYHTKVTSKGWFGYVKKKSKKYAELLTLLESYEGTYDEVVVYREPKRKTILWHKATVKNLMNLVEIHTLSGAIIKQSTPGDIRLDTTELITNVRLGRSDMIKIDKIRHIIIEEV